MENLPFNQNINWAAAGAAVVTLFAYFFPGLPENVRNAILTLALVGVVIVIPYLHTFVNHPANKEAAGALVDKAVAKAKNIAPVLMTLFVIGFLALSLSACSSLGGYFDNPQNDLQIAQASFSTALTLYESMCNANTAASICSPANIQEAADLEAAAVAAIKVAESVLTVSGGTAPSSADIQTDVNDVVVAVQKFSDFVNQLQAQKTQAAALRAALAHH